MKLFDFISSLLPHFNKDRILEDLRITKNELEQGLIPSYKEAVKFFNSPKIQSEEVKGLSDIFYRNFTSKSRKAPNIVMEIQGHLDSLKDNLEFIESELDDLLEKDIIKDGLTAKKAILVRAASHLSFITRYSVDLLNYIYAKESKAYTGEDSDTFDLSVMQEKVISNNVVNYAKLLAIYGSDNKVFKDKYVVIPDVIINQKNYGLVSSTFKEDKVDPYSSMLIQGFEANPIYHFRLMVAEWQANRYKAFKDKKKMLELRLLNLKMQKDQSPDPKIEKEISYLQDRIDTIEYKMKKMEDSVE